MDEQQHAKKRKELEELRSRVAQLERETSTSPPHWQATQFYTAYYATTGFVLGMFGAASSLLQPSLLSFLR